MCPWASQAVAVAASCGCTQAEVWRSGEAGGDGSREPDGGHHGERKVVAEAVRKLEELAVAM